MYDYSDGYVLVSESISIDRKGDNDAENEGNKVLIFKNCASFTECIGNINST